MKKVGILGGTFNPPHIGHLIVANEVKHALNLDEVRLMPSFQPPHKNLDGNTTAEHRIRMVSLAVKNLDGILPFPYEINQGGISYTFHTMKNLTEEEDAEFYFIIGGDMIHDLPNWYRIDDLLEIVTFVGVNRPGWKNETDYPILRLTIPDINLSSTLIRNRLQKGETVALLIPEEVEAYIRKEGLYGAH